MYHKIPAIIILVFSHFILFSQVTWEHLDGPYGSNSSILFSNDDYIFIPEIDFLYKTPDGVHWQKKEFDNAVWLGGYKNLIINLYKPGSNVYLSTSVDNGETWETKQLSNTFRHISYRFTVCEHGVYFPDFVNRVLFRSTDLGNNWSSLPLPENVNEINSFENRLYMFGDSSLLYSGNQGTGWIDLTPYIPDTETRIDDVIVKDSNIVFTTQHYVFYSHDFGQTWNTFNANSSFDFDKLALVGDQIYFSFDHFLLRTNDFGIHWDTLLNDTDPFDLISHTAFKNDYIVSTAVRGVFRWADTLHSFVEINSGLSKGFIFDMSLNNHKLWTACGNGLFYYDVQEAEWSEKMDLPLSTESILFQKHFVSTNNVGWVVTEGSDLNHFYFSKDDGANWDTIDPSVYDIKKVQLLSEDIFLFTQNALYHSNDEGESWKTVRSEKVENDIILYKENYYMVCSDSLYVSNNSFLSWATVHTPFRISGLSTYDGELFAYTEESYVITNIYKSVDGVEWTDFDNGLEGVGIINSTHSYTTKPYFFKDSAYYYAFLSHSLHISPIDSIEWTIISPPHPGNEIIVTNDHMYLGSEGLYHSPLLQPFLTSVFEELTRNNLFTIIPNPANESIAVTFAPEAAMDGLLQIFTSDGILITSDQINNITEGVNISTMDFANGIYYLLFKGDKMSDRKSFIILHQ